MCLRTLLTVRIAMTLDDSQIAVVMKCRNVETKCSACGSCLCFIVTLKKISLMGSWTSVSISILEKTPYLAYPA